MPTPTRTPESTVIGEVYEIIGEKGRTLSSQGVRCNPPNALVETGRLDHDSVRLGKDRPLGHAAHALSLRWRLAYLSNRRQLLASLRG